MRKQLDGLCPMIAQQERACVFLTSPNYEL
jgi:hypothetical protein